VTSLAFAGSRGSRATGDLLLLLGLGAVVIGAGIGLRDAWAPDEPRFVLIARDMLASGNWLFPTRGGELYADKPPLFFWVMAAAMGAIGSMKLAFLVPSLIASLVTLGLVHDIARRLWGGRAGLVAGLLLLLTLQFTQHAKAAHIDAMLCMWTTLSLYGLVRHLLLGPSWGWYTIAWLAAGFGVITKGVGFLALFALLPYAYARARDWPGVVRGGGWRWIAGAGAMLLPIAAWLVPMLYEVQSSGSPALAAWRDDLLLRQTFHRYANAIGHVHGWWYYLAGVIPLFWLPGTALLPWLVPAWTRDLKARDARTLILLGLTAAIVVFFTLSPGKRGVYLLPAVPVFALAAAPHVRDLLARRAVRVTGFALAAVAALVFLGLAAWLELAGTERVEALSHDYGVSAAAVAAGFGLLAALALLFGVRRGHVAVGATIAGFWLLGSLWLYPALNPVRSSATLMRSVETALAPGEDLGIVRYREQFLLQARVPVTHFGYRRADSDEELHDAVGWLTAAPNRRLLVDAERMQQCFSAADAQPVGFASEERWYLARPADATGACASGGAADQAIVYGGHDE
jgi:4-amino-4-deoxy-L-arabinose transferase-like glycosyltransferase